MAIVSSQWQWLLQFIETILGSSRQEAMDHSFHSIRRIMIIVSCRRSALLVRKWLAPTKRPSCFIQSHHHNIIGCYKGVVVYHGLWLGYGFTITVWIYDWSMDLWLGYGFMIVVWIYDWGMDLRLEYGFMIGVWIYDWGMDLRLGYGFTIGV